MPSTLIIVLGRAKSKKSKSRLHYEQSVAQAASKRFIAPLREGALSLEVHHFRFKGALVDLDNLLKAILDGLKGVAYVDDALVTRVCAERHDAARGLTVEVREEWVDLIAKQEDFVSIEVIPPSDDI
ncbi:MAG: RusA family crossover junction endodeoxyribonuclease [Chloroflexi bacterium]|nr:RusA family crossover junction endodeoxyribonuclease [Chloroflexota bacterium]